MMRLARRLLPLCVLVLGTACGDDDDDDGPVDRNIDGSTPFGDASMDAKAMSEQDAALDAGGQWAGETPLLPACPSGTAQCLRTGAAAWTVLLEASRFGVDAQFEALGEGAVVVHSSSPAWQVARLARDTRGSVPEVDVWTAPANVAALIDALDATELADRVYALGCPEDDSGCSLLVGMNGTTMLSEVSGGRVPTVIRDLRGLSYDPAAQRICVYGSGLLCFKDGVWTTQIDPSSEVLLRDVKIDSRLGIAVGASGAIWTSRRDGEHLDNPWLPLEREGFEDLDAVSVNGDHGFVRGGGGLWAWSRGADRQCDESGTFSAVWTGSITQALTDDGRLLSYDTGATGPRWCTAQQLMPLEVIASDNAPCGIAQNPRVLTRAQLIGMNACAID